MVDAKRLERNLTNAIQLAQDLYEDANPVSIWDSFYQAISQLPIRQQLLISGEALKELAHVTLLKSEAYSSSEEPVFEEKVPEGAGVILDDEWLAKLALKTSSLDLSRFVEPDTRLRLPGEGLLYGPVAAPDDLSSSQLDDTSENLEETLAFAHSESSSEWQDIIFSALKCESQPIDFWALKTKTFLSPSALFLGLLLGSERWHLEQTVSLLDSDEYGSVSVSLNKFGHN